MDSLIAQYRIWISRVIGALFIALIVFTSSRLTGSVAGALLAFFGLLLVGLSVAGRLWCSLYIAGYKNQQLIRSGPYSMTRNPLYFFSFLGFTGIGMATQSLTIGLGTAILFLLFYPYVIRHEESFLRREFGADFDDYMRTTPRFWPNPKLLHEPEKWQVNPRTFRREVGDVLGFVLAVALVMLVGELHRMGLIEPWAYLP